MDSENPKKSDTKVEARKGAVKEKTARFGRKYSDTKYDKPEFEAKIEQQTIKAVEALIKEPIVKKEESKMERKNLFGLAFDIPDELKQIIEKEMQLQAEHGTKPWKEVQAKKTVNQNLS